MSTPREIILNPGESLIIKCSGATNSTSIMETVELNSPVKLNSSVEPFEAPVEAPVEAVDPATLMGGGKRKSKTRKAKGSKKSPNGYMKFASEVRPQILKENPGLKSDVVKVARKIGEKWRALTDAEKKRY
jgi:hypothetical protein